MNTRLTGIQVGVDNNSASMFELQRCVVVDFSNAPQQIETSMKLLLRGFFSIVLNHFSQADDRTENNNDAIFSPPSTSTTQVFISDLDINNNFKQASFPGINCRLKSSCTSATAMWNQ